MYTSTEISSWAGLGSNEKVIKLFKEAGFTAYDYSMFFGGLADEVLYADDYIERAKKFRAYADEVGLPCNQAHAPFPTAKKGDEAYNADVIWKIRRAIEVSGILGAKVCVVHPCNDYTPEENAALYKNFEETARKAGVKIGVENMWNWDHEKDQACAAACSHHDNFKAHMDLLPKDVFVACLDIGHAEMKGLDTDLVQMIETLGEDLQALHIHDNDRLHDNHRVPFTMQIDFEKMIEALRKIGYKGDITLEANPHLPVELMEVGARFMAGVANYIKERVEK